MRDFRARAVRCATKDRPHGKLAFTCAAYGFDLAMHRAGCLERNASETVFLAKRGTMHEPLPILTETSIQIAWDYLDRTGDLGDPDIASRFLVYAVEQMIQRGERRRLMLSNRAIDSYKRYRVQRGLAAA
jgi:hypothetical protein